VLVVPRLRARFGPAEIEALEAAIGRLPDPDAVLVQDRLDSEGVDAALTHPAFHTRSLWGDPDGLSDVPLPLLVYAAVRSALSEEGVDDAEEADYVATVLWEFSFGQRAFHVDPYGEQRGDYLVDILRSARDGMQHAHQHLGNFALWTAGIFPDRVAKRHARKGAPGLDYYETMGRAGFREAADHPRARSEGIDGLMSHLAAGFRRARRALNRVSDELFFPGVGTDPVERLLRQAAF
jgi:hypothetical protein